MTIRVNLQFVTNDTVTVQTDDSGQVSEYAKLTSDNSELTFDWIEDPNQMCDHIHTLVGHHGCNDRVMVMTAWLVDDPTSLVSHSFHLPLVSETLRVVILTQCQSLLRSIDKRIVYHQEHIEALQRQNPTR